MILTPPVGARWCPRSHWGKKSTYYLHFSHGFLEHDDSKMFSFLYFGHTFAQTIQTGGMFYNVSKSSLLRPLAEIIFAADRGPRQPAGAEGLDTPYLWREEQAINALCAEVKRVRAEKAAKGFDETAIDK